MSSRLMEIIAEEEYSIELRRLDVVWRRVEQSVPTYVFEVNVKGGFYRDLFELNTSLTEQPYLHSGLLINA